MDLRQAQKLLNCFVQIFTKLLFRPEYMHTQFIKLTPVLANIFHFFVSCILLKNKLTHFNKHFEMLMVEVGSGFEAGLRSLFKR